MKFHFQSLELHDYVFNKVPLPVDEPPVEAGNAQGTAEAVNNIYGNEPEAAENNNNNTGNEGNNVWSLEVQ